MLGKSLQHHIFVAYDFEAMKQILMQKSGCCCYRGGLSGFANFPGQNIKAIDKWWKKRTRSLDKAVINLMRMWEKF